MYVYGPLTEKIGGVRKWTFAYRASKPVRKLGNYTFGHMNRYVHPFRNKFAHVTILLRTGTTGGVECGSMQKRALKKPSYLALIILTHFVRTGPWKPAMTCERCSGCEAMV